MSQMISLQGALDKAASDELSRIVADFHSREEGAITEEEVRHMAEVAGEIKNPGLRDVLNTNAGLLRAGKLNLVSSEESRAHFEETRSKLERMRVLAKSILAVNKYQRRWFVGEEKKTQAEDMLKNIREEFKRSASLEQLQDMQKGLQTFLKGKGPSPT